MIRKSVPNLITAGNLFCGVLAIVAAFEGRPSYAVLLIVIAMILDAFDGRVARMLNVDGEFGKEFDSLADVVTFGVAPSLLLYTVLLQDLGTAGLFLMGLFPICGALRLAKFNTDTHKIKNSFVGLPITAAGGILALFAANYHHFNATFLLLLMLILATLMVSNVRFPNFKKVKLPKYFYIVVPTMAISIFIFLKLFPQSYESLLLIPLGVLGFIVIHKIRVKKHHEIINENPEEENYD